MTPSFEFIIPPPPLPEVTLDEFINGVLRCRGPARAIDQVALHADLARLEAKVDKIADHILGPRQRVTDRRVESMKAFRIDASIEVKSFLAKATSRTMSRTMSLKQ